MGGGDVQPADDQADGGRDAVGHRRQSHRPVACPRDEPRQRIGDRGLTGDSGEQLHQGDRRVPEPEIFRRVQARGDDPVGESEDRREPDVGDQRIAVAQQRIPQVGADPTQHARRQRHVLCDGPSARLGCAGGSAARTRQFGRYANDRCPQPGPAGRMARVARPRPLRTGDAIPRVGRRNVCVAALRGREPALRVRERAACRASPVAAHSRRHRRSGSEQSDALRRRWSRRCGRPTARGDCGGADRPEPAAGRRPELPAASTHGRRVGGRLEPGRSAGWPRRCPAGTHDRPRRRHGASFRRGSGN